MGNGRKSYLCVREKVMLGGSTQKFQMIQTSTVGVSREIVCVCVSMHMYNTQKYKKEERYSNNNEEIVAIYKKRLSNPFYLDHLFCYM